MNTTKKIAVVLAVMVVTAMAAPAAMAEENLGYSATVGLGQNTVLTMVSGYGFGSVASPSVNNTINNTFKLNNDGNKAAQVKARFTTSAGTPVIYGLTNAPNVIGGSNFSLQADHGGSKDALYNNGTDVTLSYPVPADGNDHNYDAWLDVPSQMPDGSYNGNVTLTFVTATP